MILAAVSGGFDSTVMAWRLLTQTQTPLHIHYVSLRARTGRWKAEEAAMQKIIPWLRAHTRPFGYTTSIRSTTSRLPDIAIVSDECAKLVAAGKLPRPVAFVRGAQADDYLEHGLAGRQRAALRRWQMHFADAAPPIEFPIKHLTRAQLYSSAPPELVKITWTCRHPRIVDNQFTQCRHCKACKELAKARVPFERDLEHNMGDVSHALFGRKQEPLPSSL